MTTTLNLFTLVMLKLLLMKIICSLYSPECVFVVCVMFRDPVWWPSFSPSLNLSLHWTSVQIWLWSPVISAMRISLKYHIITSFVFFITPGSKVTDSPSFTSYSLAAETPETQTNRCWRILSWRNEQQQTLHNMNKLLSWMRLHKLSLWKESLVLFTSLFISNPHLNR